jgi:hypothetical protein
MMKTLTLLLALTLLAGTAIAAEPPTPNAPASFASVKVADLSWIAGNWQGEIGGDFIEEQWSAPAGGTLMGMFRWIKGGKDGTVALYELLTLEPGAEGPILWLRHFSPGLVAREDKEGALAFYLVAHKPDEATFDNRDPGNPTRLTYRRQGDDRLVVVLGKLKDGNWAGTDFVYRRK